MYLHHGSFGSVAMQVHSFGSAAMQVHGKRSVNRRHSAPPDIPVFCRDRRQMSESE